MYSHSVFNLVIVRIESLHESIRDTKNRTTRCSAAKRNRRRVFFISKMLFYDSKFRTTYFDKNSTAVFFGGFFAVITDFLVGNYDGDRQLRPLIKRAVMVIYGF